ncbi:MAG: 30S ribosomal protein S20 [Firmicutes bacterium]|nr:30S ribosomal protein S20 [Bacillota bacterium]
MPNIKSAKKRVKISAVKRVRNTSAKSAIKTTAKKYEQAVNAGEQEKATVLFQKVSSQLDKAAAKGIIHKNAAARRKSRLAAKL